MRAKKGFLKRQVGDRAVVVPVGEAAKAFHGMINLMEMYEIEEDDKEWIVEIQNKDGKEKNILSSMDI